MADATQDEALDRPLRLVLAGRTFRDAGRMLSAAQEQWVGPHLRAAGLYDYLSGKLQMGEGEEPAEFFQRITARLHDSGRMLHIAAGLVEEDGKPTPAHPDDLPAFMDERMRFFGGLRDPADRAALTRHVMELVLRFFGSGLASLKTFLTSSSNTSEPFEAAKSSAGTMSSA